MKVGDLLSQRKMDYFYIMHLSYDGRESEKLWDYARQNSQIGLQLPDIVTNDWNKIKGSIKKGSIERVWTRQFELFCNKIKVGDIVLVLCGWDSLLGIAEIAQPYQFVRSMGYSSITQTGIFFDHVRKVSWIEKYAYSKRLMIPQPAKGFNNTLSRVEPTTKRWMALTNLNI